MRSSHGTHSFHFSWKANVTLAQAHVIYYFTIVLPLCVRPLTYLYHVSLQCTASNGLTRSYFDSTNTMHSIAKASMKNFITVSSTRISSNDSWSSSTLDCVFYEKFYAFVSSLQFVVFVLKKTYINSYFGVHTSALKLYRLGFGPFNKYVDQMCLSLGSRQLSG